MSWKSPFHEGELEAQSLAGERDSAESNSAMVSDKMFGGALNFIRLQAMAVFSTRDAQGQRWASVVFGKPGFLEPSDRQTLHIAIPKGARDSNDPLWKNLAADPRAGILLIDFETRRRIRINGEARLSDQEILLNVTESFPICPKYITRRKVEVVSPVGASSDSQADSGTALTPQLREAISRTDVLFLASGHSKRGNDASHRGGSPGFVEVGANSLRIPDYPGNGMFNGLGNLLSDPHVGMLFPFFKEGRQLQITAEAKILWDQPDSENKTGGTNRFVEFNILRWLQRSLPAVLKASIPEPSPYNP